MFDRRYDDEYAAPSPEDVKSREEEDARRLIRDEIRRIRSGEGAEQMAAEEAEEAERAEAEAAERQLHRRWRKFVAGSRKLLSGDILADSVMSRFFDYAGVVAFMFFLSIVVIFWSLRVDMQYNRLSQQVDLLHERAVMLKERRYRECSHSEIERELRRRGIGLYDPERPATRIE